MTCREVRPAGTNSFLRDWILDLLGQALLSLSDESVLQNLELYQSKSSVARVLVETKNTFPPALLSTW